MSKSNPLPIARPDEPAESAEPAGSAGSAGSAGPSRINIRNLSVKCGNCDTYQTLSHFKQTEEWNVYTYECENDICDPTVTRTYLEVPAELDEFANRDPTWQGGKKHTGGGH